MQAIKAISYPAESEVDYYYQGPTTIVYDSHGINPKYYDGEIGLYSKRNNSLKTDVKWSL